MKRLIILVLALLAPSLALAQARPPAQKTGPITIYGTGSSGPGGGFSASPSLSAPDGTINRLLADRVQRNLTGAPDVQADFVGSATPALFGQTMRLTAASTAKREIAAQFIMTSEVGNKDPAVDKLALVASTLGGPNSSPVYAGNFITQGYAGPGGYLVTGFESDINNLGDHADTFGNQSSYGVVSVAAGTKRSTAAYWATAASAKWNYGFAVTDYVQQGASQAGFLDGSSSPIAFKATNQHVTLLDGSEASSLGTGMSLPNNTTAIRQKTSAGVSTQTLRLNAGNGLEIGDPSLPAIQLRTTTYIDAAAIQLTGGARMFVPGDADSCGSGYRCLRIPN